MTFLLRILRLLVFKELWYLYKILPIVLVLSYSDFIAIIFIIKKKEKKERETGYITATSQVYHCFPLVVIVPNI